MSCKYCNPYSDFECFCQCHDINAQEGHIGCDPVEMYD